MTCSSINVDVDIVWLVFSCDTWISSVYENCVLESLLILGGTGKGFSPKYDIRVGADEGLISDEGKRSDPECESTPFVEVLPPGKRPSSTGEDSLIKSFKSLGLSF